MLRPLALTLTSLALAGCSVLPGRSDSRDSRAERPTSPRTEARAPAISTSPAVRQCLAGLGTTGARFTPLPDQYRGEGCSTLGTVQLTALSGDYDQMVVSNLGPTTCDVTSAFAGWARYGVDRAARQILGSPLKSIETYGSYSCRDVAGTGRRSAHATAAAIDISGFTLADGRKIGVESHWNGGNAAEREFLRVVHASACKRFGTILGPDYNAAHRNHFHVEGVVDGKSYCR